MTDNSNGQSKSNRAILFTALAIMSGGAAMAVSMTLDIGISGYPQVKPILKAGGYLMIALMVLFFLIAIGNMFSAAKDSIKELQEIRSDRHS